MWNMWQFFERPSYKKILIVAQVNDFYYLQDYKSFFTLSKTLKLLANHTDLTQ
jgi:hypothetical protein